MFTHPRRVSPTIMYIYSVIAQAPAQNINLLQIPLLKIANEQRNYAYRGVKIYGWHFQSKYSPRWWKQGIDQKIFNR